MSEQVAEFKKNDLVEGYQILDQIGEGAASQIYLVKDPKTKEIWALKHVHREGHKDLRFLEQAILEYEVASALNHPGIRKIVRLIKRKRLLQLSAVILLMEFLDGYSMEKKPPRDNLELAVDLFAQSAQALRHMHDRGFVHADMKPNNIVVCDQRIVKIIDLGQSCRAGTVKPRIQGTPDYIAPEQVHRRPITPKTDIYNMGATMYWALTGEFIPTALAKGDSLVSRLDDNLLPKPKPASDFNPAVPPRLNDLIMQCVEVDPDKRPADMGVIVDQLTLILGIIRARGAAAAKANQGSAAGVRLNQGSGAGMSANQGSGAGAVSLNPGGVSPAPRPADRPGPALGK